MYLIEGLSRFFSLSSDTTIRSHWKFIYHRVVSASTW